MEMETALQPPTEMVWLMKMETGMLKWTAAQMVIPMDLEVTLTNSLKQSNTHNWKVTHVQIKEWMNEWMTWVIYSIGRLLDKASLRTDQKFDQG